MISVKSLRVDYDTVTAVEDLDLEVAPGEIFGLLGPNGAGKTSTIKAIARAIEPTYGEIRIDGVDPDVHPEEAWRRIGYMPDLPPLYPDLTVRQYLDVFAAAHLVARPGRADRVRDWAARVDLEKKLDTRVSELSRGMKQRLVLAKTLLPEPKALLLDEPASGMDPLSLHLVHSVLRQAAEDGTAVLLSTHHLDEVVAYCTRVAILEEGALIDEVNLFDRRERFRARVTDLAAGVRALEAQPEAVTHATIRGTELVFIPRSADDLGRVSTILAEAGVGVLEMNRDVFDLRAYYRERVSAERARRTGQLTATQDGRATGTGHGGAA